MDNSSWLIPASIKAQCSGAIRQLQKDNESLITADGQMDAFINNDEIKSSAFDTMKQQINDYKTISQAIRCANESDIADFETLQGAVGDEVLRGDNILSQKHSAEQSRDNNENTAQYYWDMTGSTDNVFFSVYYGYMANRHTELARVDQEIYDKWLEKEEAYDQIESATSGLFAAAEGMRSAVEAGISDISGAFVNGAYAPNMNAAWRENMQKEFNKITGIGRAGKELGLSEEEIDNLKRLRMDFTAEDIKHIKESKGTERIFVSADNKALFYDGKIYPIYAPTNGITIGPKWNVDGKREIGKTEFNWAAGMLGIELEELSKDEIRTQDWSLMQSSNIYSNDKNVTNAAILHAVMGFGNFLNSSLTHSEVELVFQSSEGGNRRVTIGVGNSKTRKQFQNINYNISTNTYRVSETSTGKQWASDYAAGVYLLATGNEVPDKNATYTLTQTFDKRHKEDMI